MDRKSIIILVVCFILLMLWFPLVNRIFPPKPLPPGATNAPVTLTGTNLSAPANAVSNGGAGAAAPLVAEVPLTTAAPDAPEETIVITNVNGRYTFTSLGGGLKLAELVDYPESVAGRRGAPVSARFASLNAHSPHPALAVTGGAAVEGDRVFRLTRIERGVRAEKVLSNGLTLTKTFTLSSNYLVAATVRLENRSGRPLDLPAQEWIVGTASPMNARDDGTAVGTMWFDGSRHEDITEPWFLNKTMGCFPGTPRSVYYGGASNVSWAAVHNQFFTLAAMPKTPAQQVIIRRVTLPRYEGEEARLIATNRPAPTGYYTTLLYPAATLSPGQALERDFQIFAGPKEYQTLAQISATFKNEIDRVMGFGTWFGFFSKALLLGMNWLHDTLRFSYGWAIVAITIVIKLLFWPLTKASTRSMKRMQALQPQMKAIQEKYKDDPARMNRKMMEFMKENKVSPLGGCLPMLLQMPVFIGFFYMIQSAIELRGAPWLWVADLSRPDTLAVIPGLGFIPFIGVAGVGLPFNLLPLIMGVTMFWQAKLTPPSPGMDPMQAKIMRYMPMMFVLFLYNFSAGLTLYWTVQNILTIAQTKLTSTADPVRPAATPAPAHPPRKKK